MSNTQTQQTFTTPSGQVTSTPFTTGYVCRLDSWDSPYHWMVTDYIVDRCGGNVTDAVRGAWDDLRFCVGNLSLKDQDRATEILLAAMGEASVGGES